MAVSVVSSDLVKLIKASYVTDVNIQNTGWSLRKKDILVIGPNENLRNKLLTWHCALLECGHSCRVRKLESLFYWKGMTRDVKIICEEMSYVSSMTHQQNQPGLLQVATITYP